MNLRRTAVLLSLLGATQLQAQDNLTLSCPVCHGQRNAPWEIPGLHAHTPEQLEKILREYRGGTRPGTAMPRLAAAWSDEEIRRFAQVYGVPQP